MAISKRSTGINRSVGNRGASPLLTRMPGYGTIHHRGRKSGREYATPVKIFRRGDRYAIMLPYSSKADWVRNVIAAGGAELETSGRRIRLTNPVVKSDSGRGLVPRWAHWAMSLIGAREYIVLNRTDSQQHG